MNPRPVLLALALASCATTTFESTWRSPDSRPISLAGKKILTLFPEESEGTRRAAEDALAREVSARGAQGVPGYSVLSGDELKDKTAAKAELEREGIAGIVVMKKVGEKQELGYVPGAERHFWGGAWGAGWSTGYVTTDTVVRVETRVFSLERDELLWAGISETLNPSKLEPFIEELAQAVADQMREEGLLAK